MLILAEALRAVGHALKYPPMLGINASASDGGKESESSLGRSSRLPLWVGFSCYFFGCLSRLQETTRYIEAINYESGKNEV